MTDEAWIRGMAELLATFPDKDQDRDVMSVRGQVYRRELGKLTDQSWLYAVSEAVRNERWFPTVAALLDYANDAPQPPPAGLLPAHEPNREEQRETAKKGIELIRQALRERGVEVPCNPVQGIKGGA